MKITLTGIFGILVLGSMMAQAQTETLAETSSNATEIAALMTPVEAPVAAKPEFELTCRSQAKEIAANAYRSCVTDGRNAQIEQLKKAYQDQIAALKTKYEAEIKALAAVNAQNAAAANVAAVTAEPAVTEVAAPVAAEAKAVAPAKAVKASKTAPLAKAKKKAAAPLAATKSAKPALTKVAVAPVAPAPVKVEDIKEMTIELKPTAKTVGAADESTMDLPEPIPVESNSRN